MSKGDKDDEEKSCGPWSWGGSSSWLKHLPFAALTRGSAAPRGRMFGQGDLRLLLLALVADAPRHGYELIRLIEARFGGAYAPSPGVVYPTLASLESEGLLQSRLENTGKKSFSVTPEGLRRLEESKPALEALRARIDIMAGASQGGAPPESVMGAAQALRHAILAKPGGWGPAEEARVRGLLEDAARRIVAGG